MLRKLVSHVFISHHPLLNLLVLYIICQSICMCLPQNVSQEKMCSSIKAWVRLTVSMYIHLSEIIINAT